MQIDTADVVLHKPTGERWVVAYVRDDRLAWVGWPEGEAALGDCELVSVATDEQRIKLLEQMAQARADDSRARYARHRLGIRDAPSAS
jgi:hypothetical protein